MLAEDNEQWDNHICHDIIHTVQTKGITLYLSFIITHIEFHSSLSIFPDTIYMKRNTIRCNSIITVV